VRIKVYLVDLPPFGWNSNELFTVGKWYDAEPTPIMYDPNTFKPYEGYIVICNDGNWRKVDSKYFITQQEWREMKLKELGI
jgi:hypothetical protein